MLVEQELNQVSSFLLPDKILCGRCFFERKSSQQSQEWYHQLCDCPHMHMRCLRCFGDEGHTSFKSCSIELAVSRGICSRCRVLVGTKVHPEKACGQTTKQVAASIILPVAWAYVRKHWRTSLQTDFAAVGASRVGGTLDLQKLKAVDSWMVESLIPSEMPKATRLLLIFLAAVASRDKNKRLSKYLKDRWGVCLSEFSES